VTATKKGKSVVHHSLRDQGRMGFKQCVDKAVSAFVRSPEGGLLDLTGFDPKYNDLGKQRAVLAAFAKFLSEHS
jgi:hypothetical protein